MIVTGRGLKRRRLPETDDERSLEMTPLEIFFGPASDCFGSVAGLMVRSSEFWSREGSCRSRKRWSAPARLFDGGRQSQGRPPFEAGRRR